MHRNMNTILSPVIVCALIWNEPKYKNITKALGLSKRRPHQLAFKK